MESVVFELADFFGVSKLSAKIRMIDLGYKEAIGVFTYVDDHYISNSFEAAAMQKNQTFCHFQHRCSVQLRHQARFP